MLNKLRTVDYWHSAPYSPFETPDCLQKAFEIATGEGSPVSYFFSDIWIPVLTRDTNHKPVVGTDGNFVVTYKNVGLTTQQMADAYWTEYSRNLLVQPLSEETETADVSKLAKRIRSMFLLNKYKYLKWIDTMGYAYNPLWNVDGTESYQYIDKHGDVTTKDTPILQTDTTTGITTYDSSSLRDLNKTTNTFDGLTDTGNNYYSKNVTEYNNITTDSIDGPVKAITGGDYSHIEKRIRQGNIGITETTALITHERELVRLNLIQEFFDDINKQILVGIFV